MTTNNAVNVGLSGSTGTGSFVGSTSPALTTPNLGTPSAINLTNATGFPASALPSGTLFNFQQGQLTTTTTVTATATFTAISGLSVVITPTSASNSVLVRANICIGAPNNSDYMIARLMRGATPIAIGTSVGSRTACSAYMYVNSAIGDSQVISIEWLDAPATTSSTTYTVQLYAQGGSTFSINVSPVADTNAAGTPRPVSIMSAMEVHA